jgi:S-(hydroxymethyl)glutathione dehydrogenase/alcohol dehydrogenase
MFLLFPGFDNERQVLTCFFCTGFKSRKDIPKLVDRCMSGELPIDHYITHTFQGVGKTNDAIDALHSGDCLRAVVRYE